MAPVPCARVSQRKSGGTRPGNVSAGRRRSLRADGERETDYL